MGHIYQRTWKDKKGEIHQSPIWWVKFHKDGRPYYESSGSTIKGDAKRLLKDREGDIVKGVAIAPRMGSRKFKELVEDVLTDYKINAKKSYKQTELRFRLHILPYFGHLKVSLISTSTIQQYVAKRQEENAANGTINRETTLIARAFNLAKQSGKVGSIPYIPKLKENNVRKGFFEPEQFRSVHRYLPDYLQPFAHFGYLTGWRRSEISGLQWRQVDFEVARVSLDVGSTKNGEGRSLKMTYEMRELLENQKKHTLKLQHEEGKVIPSVFHRNGKPIGDFRKAWATACKKAAVPGRLFHDLRRTAVRNLVRLGIPERVCMELTGHKTREVFERYNIVSEGDLDMAAQKQNESGLVTVLVTVGQNRPNRLKDNAVNP